MKKQESSYSFKNKWSSEIAKWGYTPIPNLLIYNQSKLDITSSEMAVLLQLLTHMWDDRHPYPAASTLCKRSGMALQTVRTNIRRLEAKGLLRRKFRKALSNEYELTSLKAILQRIATTEQPPVQKRIPPYSKTSISNYPKMETKEDPFSKKNKLKRGPDSKNALQVGDILANKFGNKHLT
ncbi:MAG: helix-turn-helix domain-containing protein [Patescibacteria group bacterium]